MATLGIALIAAASVIGVWLYSWFVGGWTGADTSWAYVYLVPAPVLAVLDWLRRRGSAGAAGTLMAFGTVLLLAGVVPLLARLGLPVRPLGSMLDAIPLLGDVARHEIGAGICLISGSLIVGGWYRDRRRARWAEDHQAA